MRPGVSGCAAHRTRCLAYPFPDLSGCDGNGIGPDEPPLGRQGWMLLDGGGGVE
jgi:hypothetical protein